MGVALPADRITSAMGAIRTWRAAPDQPVACPICNKDTLTVQDRSARPVAEWYALSCSSCDLDATINIPMSPPSSSSD